MDSFGQGIADKIQAVDLLGIGQFLFVAPSILAHISGRRPFAALFLMLDSGIVTGCTFLVGLFR